MTLTLAEALCILVLQKALEGYRKLQARRSSVHVILSFCRTLQNQRPPGWPILGSLEVYDCLLVAGLGFGRYKPSRTKDLRGMSLNPESVPFVRWVLQSSQTDERWALLARHAAIVDRCAYSSPFTWVRQVLFIFFLYVAYV